MLVIMAGLPASGKSTLARALAIRLHGAVLDKDSIRAALFQTSDIEYSAAQDDFIMDLMLQTARHLIDKDQSRFVFLDGRTFSKDYQRRRAIEAADSMNTPWLVIECVCSENNASKRLAIDAVSGTHPAANRNMNLWHNVRTAFDLIELPKIEINTDRSLEECIALAMSALGPGLRQVF